MSNQYFQIVFHEKDAYLHVYPPTEGGACLKAAEVTQYLDFRNFKSYDVKEIGAALNSKEDTEVFVGPWDGIPVHEAMDVQFSLDKMKAICRFYPPSEGGKLKSDSEIASDLVFRKVKYGIDQEEISRFTENRQYCTDYVMARGTQPIHGRDAKIEYFFNTNRNLQPKRNEDGSVDYKDINTISHIHEGDLLARLIKEDPGTSGQTVFGDEIKPRTVKTMILEYGQNIEINEDHTELRSMVTGHVSLTNGKVFVSNVLEITGDVDNSVGNIHYDGSVTVRGNVKAGFSIVAKCAFYLGDYTKSAEYADKYIEAVNYFMTHPEERAKQEGFPFVSETLDEVKQKEMYSIAICDGLRRDDTAPLDKYMDKLQWGEKHVYVFEEMADELLRGMQKLGYTPEFYRLVKIISRHQALKAYFLAKVEEASERGEDMTVAVSICNKVEETGQILKQLQELKENGMEQQAVLIINRLKAILPEDEDIRKLK